ncbi:MAG: hypothetical protein KDK72_10650, partial [Chlamydiia bacterium]|nr:hypothetical protein [Chlamydiia bacterium]
LFPSTVLFLFLVFVARPFVVLCSGAFFYLPWRESLFLCCLAPRGIVTAVVASLFTMQLARIDYINAASLAPMTITIICMTVLFYSIVARIAAHLLGVSRGAKQSILIIGANDVSGPIAEALVDAGYQLHVIDPNSVKAMDMAAETLPIFPGTFLDFEKQYPDFVEEADMLLAMTESSDINSLAIIHFRFSSF